MMGLSPSCIESIDELIDFLFMNTNGIVVVDSSSKRLRNFIVKYSQHQVSTNLSFIFLNDNLFSDISCDNMYTFLSNYDRINITIESVINKSLHRKKYLDCIPEVFINTSACNMLDKLHFPKSFNGYGYILDCVHLMISHENMRLSLTQIYENVATKYNKKSFVIEKGIRHIIKSVYETNESFVEIFGDNKVSNLSFLKYIIEKIKFDYSQEVSC